MSDRKRSALWSTLAVTALGAGAWHYLAQPERNAHGNTAAAAAATVDPAAPIVDADAWALAITSDADRDIPPPALAPENMAARMAELAAAARDDDALKRADAIDELARAPKLHAVPVLQSLLSATLEDDRQRVVSALHTIAVEQGDDDGRIAEVLRLTIYDGDAAGVADSAQVVLDSIQVADGQIDESAVDEAQSESATLEITPP